MQPLGVGDLGAEAGQGPGDDLLHVLHPHHHLPRLGLADPAEVAGRDELAGAVDLPWGPSMYNVNIILVPIDTIEIKSLKIFD